MRVGQNQNITMFAGQQPGSTEALAEKENGRKGRGAVFAGNLNQQGLTLQERIEQRKAQAQKQAMKVVGDVFAADRAMDEDIENRRAHLKELEQERGKLQEEKQDINTQREALAQAYENGEVSQEEFEEQSSVLNEYEKAWNKRNSENENMFMQENAIIRGTRQERLKKNPMVGAQEQAEEILDAAREDIIGMAKEEGMEHIDEEAEEREEKAEEIKEKKEEQEEYIEEQKEKREEEEELLEDMPVDEMLTYDKLKQDVQDEVQDILNKMKLVAEDIKGAAVDKTV